ncbi:MAG: phosphopyruvate hydratase [Candidatus Pacebacteria bacterium]|nr:phosphopyruvate hydratase [Candidatus Paceibacterota bacterium]
MVKIKKVTAKEVFDSRGIPTLSVSCEFSSGVVGEAKVPSGKSTGSLEALELRDNDTERYEGKGVNKAIENVNTEINKNLSDKDFEQVILDEFLIKLDGTENKSRLGANAILGVSLAFARACAKEYKMELYEYLGSLTGNTNFKMPDPLLNVINGGKHSDSGLDIQEFMLVPTGFDSFYKKIEASGSVISSLRQILLDGKHEVTLGDEGGFAPKLSSNEEALEILEQAIKNAGYTNEQIKIGLDAAASSFYENGSYVLKVSLENQVKNNTEMITWYEYLVKKYPIVFIEDPLAENDWDGFGMITQKLGDKIKIVGDDLTVTNVGRIQQAIEKKAINAVLIKLNQIGSLSETIEAIKLTKEQGWIPFISHRSGETNDTFIADLAVGLSCPYIKSGSLTKEERMCKYNRLIEIENIINNK